MNADFLISRISHEVTNIESMHERLNDPHEKIRNENKNVSTVACVYWKFTFLFADVSAMFKKLSQRK